MTHAELVIRAERWLRNTRRCSVVLTEAGGTGSEIPDAIGWSLGCPPISLLVECKASRADFRADRKKVFRDDRWEGMSIGRYRYYMVPAGLVRPDELPPRWGLLEVREHSIRQTVKAKRWDLDSGGSLLGLRYEMSLMLSELSKIQRVLAGKELIPSRSANRVIRMMALQEPPK